MTDDFPCCAQQPPVVKHRDSTIAELERLRAFRAALVRECVRLRAEVYPSVISLDFVEGLIEESKK
jgi:hypothetical protein